MYAMVEFLTIRLRAGRLSGGVFLVRERRARAFLQSKTFARGDCFYSGGRGAHGWALQRFVGVWISAAAARACEEGAASYDLPLHSPLWGGGDPAGHCCTHLHGGVGAGATAVQLWGWRLRWVGRRAWCRTAAVAMRTMMSYRRE
jgi:hypothetical protein